MNETHESYAGKRPMAASAPLPPGACARTTAGAQAMRRITPEQAVRTSRTEALRARGQSIDETPALR